MTFAELIDERVENLNRNRMGDEYTRGCSLPYRDVLARWFVFFDFVRLLDRAARDPFAPTSMSVLQSAGGLIEQPVFELAAWLTDVGEALRRKPLVALPALEILELDEEG